MTKMASFEAFMENAVKPGPERAIPGCACVAMSKYGIYTLTSQIMYGMSKLMGKYNRRLLREDLRHSICGSQLSID